MSLIGSLHVVRGVCCQVRFKDGVFKGLVGWTAACERDNLTFMDPSKGCRLEVRLTVGTYDVVVYNVRENEIEWVTPVENSAQEVAP